MRHRLVLIQMQVRYHERILRQRRHRIAHHPVEALWVVGHVRDAGGGPERVTVDGEPSPAEVACEA